ncbi:uncharacterized protein LOC120395019 isoform X2 [Mauremys reevesii]|uniref:uncharacterized protein LOC120395019 isoform X2 n=1 Tax=Mauremys reevesii TaxID=260615 RepID=UPI00193F6983|nr:uncharacterized protein LOC120395019 isoform X2 [Mauremys reevesii]
MEWAESQLLEILGELGEGELQRFKDKLSEIQPKEGYQHIPSGSLRNADPPALTDLLLLFYGMDYGAEVAAEVLRAIDQGALVKRIERLIDALECEKYYFEWQLQQLRQHHFARGGFMYVKCTLNDEQYQTIRAEKTSQEKMRKLYELVPRWDKQQKDRLYQALKETNRDLVEELEGGHFVDRHREKLIQRVSEVDKVLKLLRGHTLTPEQYQSISTGRSNVEKMQKLYELVPSWRREQKDWLYRVVWITNRAVFYEFAGVGIRAQKPSTSTSPGATREHFVEQHREQLIQRASSVDTTLDVLKRSHYTWFQEQPYVVMHAPYESSTEELEESKRRTGRGGYLWNRPHILNDEQYQTIKAEKTSQEKMRKLYELMPSWDERQKDRLYHALKETNRDLVEELEGAGTPAQEPSTSTSPGATREHFVERHREQLIQRTSSVDTTLDVLHRCILCPLPPPRFQQGGAEMWPMRLRSSGCSLSSLKLMTANKSRTEELEGSMKSQGPVCQASQAHTMFPVEGSQVTGQAAGLDTTPKIVKPLPLRTARHRPSLMRTPQRPQPHDFYGGHVEVPHQISIEELTSASGIICQQTLLPSTGSVAGAAGETSRRQNPTACLRGQHKCNWCAREEEDLPEEIKPEIIQDLDGNQETYRVHFSRAGWFRCPETELEFEVRAAVTIQYGYGSWRQHLTESQEEQWMVAGPLFDIRVELTEAVAAVHLPHFLCLRDADNSRMQIVHFINEGMTLENPTRVRSFHAVLENPSFSPIGVFWRRENSDQQTQLHSIVLLYQAKRIVNLTLHLYLIPDDGSRVKAVKDYEKECQSWFVSKSHFTAKPLRFGSLYIVSSPSKITVTPKELPFLDKPAETFQPFTEVHTMDVKKELELSLVEKKDGKPIWEAVIRPEDLAPSVSSIKMQIDTHFVDQHREQLIKRVTAVDGILDSLHGLVLDTEQYQSVRAERTNPDKMRKLYELVPSWNSDCKDKLYQGLKDKHRHLVEELEEK